MLHSHRKGCILRTFPASSLFQLSVRKRIDHASFITDFFDLISDLFPCIFHQFRRTVIFFRCDQPHCRHRNCHHHNGKKDSPDQDRSPFSHLHPVFLSGHHLIQFQNYPCIKYQSCFQVREFLKIKHTDRKNQCPQDYEHRKPHAANQCSRKSHHNPQKQKEKYLFPASCFC